MVCAQVIGNDAAVAFGGAPGNFELNVMLPMLARNILASIRLLANVSRLFADRCIDGIEADVERCRELAESSPVGRDAAEPVPRLRGGRLDREAGGQGAAHDPRRRREPGDTSRPARSARPTWTRPST